VLIYCLSRCRNACFNRVLAPEGEIFSFASPSHMEVVNVAYAGAFSHKRKYPKLRRPDAACFLRSVVFVGVCQKGHPCPFGKARLPAAPLRAVPGKNADARRGMTGFLANCVTWVIKMVSRRVDILYYKSCWIINNTLSCHAVGAFLGSTRAEG
jgi:hypothetical protein